MPPSQSSPKIVSRSNNLPEMVYRAVRKQINSGHLVPGDQLTEAAIAEALGVSRTPVRESFLALAREGLLVKVGRSFMLPPLTLEDINDIGEMRRLLEPPAIKSSINRMTAATLAELENALSDQKAANAEDNIEAFIAANSRFRDTLLATVSNRRLRHAIELYGQHMHILQTRLVDLHWREIVIKNLSRLLKAMSAGDAEGAVTVWLEHIDGADAAAREWFRHRQDRITPSLAPSRVADRA